VCKQAQAWQMVCSSMFKELSVCKQAQAWQMVCSSMFMDFAVCKQAQAWQMVCNSMPECFRALESRVAARAHLMRHLHSATCSRAHPPLSRSTSVSILQKSPLTKQIESSQGEGSPDREKSLKVQTIEELLQVW